MLAVAPLIVAACAPRSVSSAPGNAPRLIGCPANLSDAPTGRRVAYRVDVRVDGTGKVITGSAQVQPRPGRVLRSAAGEQEARTRAEGCTFTPAMHDGRAVESRATVPVTISI